MIVNICEKCGLAALSLAGRPVPDNRSYGISLGTCDCCGSECGTVEIGHWFYWLDTLIFSHGKHRWTLKQSDIYPTRAEAQAAMEGKS